MLENGRGMVLYMAELSGRWTVDRPRRLQGAASPLHNYHTGSLFNSIAVHIPVLKSSVSDAR